MTTKAERIAQLMKENDEAIRGLSGKVTIYSVRGIGSLNVEVTPQGLVQFHAFCLPNLDQAGCDRLVAFLRDVHSEA